MNHELRTSSMDLVAILSVRCYETHMPFYILSFDAFFGCALASRVVA